MQVQNNNLSQNATPNFTSIRKVGISGMYKKHPNLAKELVDAFMENPTAKKLSKELDIDVFFHANNYTYSGTESSIHIFYENPAVGKLKKIWNKLIGNKEKISLHAWGNEYDTEKSLQKSTSNLVDMILPEGGKTSKHNGVLSSHIEYRLQKIQEFFAQKTAKDAEKTKKMTMQQLEKQAKIAQNKRLSDAIDKAIEQSKN